MSVRSTPTSRTCVRSWSPIPATLSTCSPSTAWDTGSPMPDHEHWGPPWHREGGPPGWGPGRHLFRRLFGFVFFLFLIAVAVGGWILPRAAGVHGGGRWLLLGLLLLLFLG